MTVRVDMRAAMDMAEAEGCSRAAAPALLRAVQEGLALAQASETPQAPEADGDGSRG